VLTEPYVTPAEFRAHPTFLDSNNLRTGFGQPQQDAALTNILLEASEWADDKVDMPLAAHVRTENARLTADRSGRLRYHPEHAPVLSVLGMSVGSTPDTLDAQVDPQVWTESDGRILVAFAPSAGAGLGTLQFGSPAVGVEQLVSWTYVAGYPSTQLAAPATVGAGALTVADSIGMAAGTVLRLWTPGLEEAVTVASVAGTTVTLAGALAHEHPAGSTCSALPSTARQAVIGYATFLLMRPASTGENSAPNQRGPSISATAGDSRRTGRSTFLYDEACKLLKPFKRIR
jgi:hypothetical protein